MIKTIHIDQKNYQVVKEDKLIEDGVLKLYGG